MLCAFISSSHFILCWPVKIKTESDLCCGFSEGWGVHAAIGFASRSVCDGGKGSLWSAQVLPSTALLCSHALPLDFRCPRGTGGSSLRPYVCCTIWQGTLTCQCHLQGLLYFIQPQLSIRDTKILLLGKCPAHWVSEFCTHILCSSKILRMVCLVFTGWSGILSSESPLSPFLLQMPFRHFP